MGKGGGRPSQPTEQNIVQSSLPKYFEPYAIDMMKRAEAESKREYTPYEGQRLADENTDTMASRKIARDVASGGIAGLDTAQTGTTAGMNRALSGMGFQSQDFDSAQAQKYMSPYLQNVLDVQKQQAILDFNRGQAGRDAAAVEQTERQERRQRRWVYLRQKVCLVSQRNLQHLVKKLERVI